MIGHDRPAAVVVAGRRPALRRLVGRAPGPVRRRGTDAGGAVGVVEADLRQDAGGGRHLVAGGLPRVSRLDREHVVVAGEVDLVALRAHPGVVGRGTGPDLGAVDEEAVAVVGGDQDLRGRRRPSGLGSQVGAEVAGARGGGRGRPVGMPHPPGAVEAERLLVSSGRDGQPLGPGPAVLPETGLEPGRVAPAAGRGVGVHLDRPVVAGRGGQRRTVVGDLGGALRPDDAAVPHVAVTARRAVGGARHHDAVAVLDQVGGLAPGHPGEPRPVDVQTERGHRVLHPQARRWRSRAVRSPRSPSGRPRCRPRRRRPAEGRGARARDRRRGRRRLVAA